MSVDATSPLEEIEAAVRARAKDISLEMSTSDGTAKLRALIEDEVARWSLDHRRGIRSFDLADPELVVERAFRNLAGYGPLAPLLADDDVWEIMINAPDQIFVKRHRGRSGYHDEVFHDDDHVVRTLTKVLDDSSSVAPHARPDSGPAGRAARRWRSSAHRPRRCQPWRTRHGEHPQVHRHPLPYASDELVERDMLPDQAARVSHCLRTARLSIRRAPARPALARRPCSRACAAELDPSLRVVVAEEVFEADVPLPNVASMQTRAAARSDPRSTFAAW